MPSSLYLTTTVSCVQIMKFVILRPQFYFLAHTEDDSDDEDFNALLPDAYEGMKHRMTVLANGGKSKDAAADDDGANAEDDPLRWVEENIPATADNENPLPVLDSEEEIETTRFELSKMQ